MYNIRRINNRPGKGVRSGAEKEYKYGKEPMLRHLYNTIESKKMLDKCDTLCYDIGTKNKNKHNKKGRCLYE